MDFLQLEQKHIFTDQKDKCQNNSKYYFICIMQTKYWTCSYNARVMFTKRIFNYYLGRQMHFP